MTNARLKELRELRVSGLCIAEVDELVGEVERLRAALLHAVEVIHVWHGDNEIWPFYLEHAPILEPIRAALEGSA